MNRIGIKNWEPRELKILKKGDVIECLLEELFLRVLMF